MANHGMTIGMLAALMAAAGTARAATTQYGSRSGFLAQVSATSTYGFEEEQDFTPGEITGFGSDFVPLTLTTGVTSNFPGPKQPRTYLYTPGALVESGVTGVTGTALSGWDNGAAHLDPVRLTFATGPAAVLGFGFDITDFGPQESVVLEITHADASTELFHVDSGPGSVSNPPFFGVVSTVPITAATVYSVTTPITFSDNWQNIAEQRPNWFDNVVVGTNTLPGDADFDGQITVNDYLALDAGALYRRWGWKNGDFNDDGVVNAADFAVINASYVAEYGPAAFADFQATHPGLFQTVPEPATVSLLVFGACGMLLRRRGH